MPHDEHNPADTSHGNPREQLAHDVAHFCHILSEQGPMSVTFVHNNTLLGLQKKHFETAVAEASRVLGGRGYVPNDEFRQRHAEGRINDRDIDLSLRERAGLDTEAELAVIGDRRITAFELLRAHLVHGIEPLGLAEWRYSLLDDSNVERLRSDLPPATRANLLKSANNDLNHALLTVGIDGTMADWLARLIGIDLPAKLVAMVADALTGDNAFAEAVEPNLRAMGVPQERWQGYLTCIDRRLESLDANHHQRAQAREVWLREEAAMVRTLAARHFNCGGTLEEIHHQLTNNIERHAAQSIRSAALASYGLHDPLCLSHPDHLQEQDPATAGVDELALQWQHMAQWGGPAVPLGRDDHAKLQALVAERLALVVELARGGDRAALQTEQLCLTVLHDLGSESLRRRGLGALHTLLSSSDSAASDLELLQRLFAADPRRNMLQHSADSLQAEIAALGEGRTHADFLHAVTGEDVSERVNDYMIRLCAAFLDEGLAAWHMPGRALGFYDAWRRLAEYDRTFDFDTLPGWRDALHHLPTRADDAVIHALAQLGIAREHWAAYLGRVLARLKGWAGMVFWRQLHPNYEHQTARPVDVLQYLAVRLNYETLLVRDLCRRNWGIDTSVGSLQHHFASHPAEYSVRRALHQGVLPDDLAERARVLVTEHFLDTAEEADPWTALADQAWSARQSTVPFEQAADVGWRLYQLAQLIGLSANDVRTLPVADRDRLIATLDAFPATAHGPVWLAAYERHYRDEIVNAMSLNRGRGRWRTRPTRPKSQVIFCIDEREEAIHRHYEELDPGHETLGAAGFFGIAIDYVGLDEHTRTPLCPAVATPLHRIFEIARDTEKPQRLPLHKRRFGFLDALGNAYWEAKRNLASSYFLIDLVGFLAALPLLGRVFFPVRYFALMGAGHEMLVPKVATRLSVSRADEAEASEQHYVRLQPVAKPIGFTDPEQADRCEAMLRNTGLTYQFAPIVIWCAHGSNSQNNPHENAHDCGACGGKHGAPNARTISAMLNRRPVRALLRERGIEIGDDTWFVGAEHNTASDLMTYYDTEDVPTTLRGAFDAVVADLHEARMRAARERCRRFASAPKDASLEASLRHVEGRAFDFSQVRPEWGHATNAFAVVGRRAVTQGVFFDRRPFIISYDPTQDATGKILERILLAVGPVGAGINLEYYFSTVDSKVYGSDTKVPHNVTGLIGIMEGAQSDLRTGLPAQMTEVHEAMRLQLVVEAPLAIAGEIYGRQPAIQELLNGQWVHLIVHVPDTDEFHMFVPGVGFVKWDEPLKPIPSVASSFDWHRGKYERFLPPAHIEEPSVRWTRH